MYGTLMYTYSLAIFPSFLKIPGFRPCRSPAIHSYKPVMAGSGLQPAIIAIIYTMLGLSGFIVMVRLWRKRKDHTLGGGNRHAALLFLLEN